MQLMQQRNIKKPKFQPPTQICPEMARRGFWKSFWACGACTYLAPDWNSVSITTLTTQILYPKRYPTHEGLFSKRWVAAGGKDGSNSDSAKNNQIGYNSAMEETRRQNSELIIQPKKNEQKTGSETQRTAPDSHIKGSRYYYNYYTCRSPLAYPC